MNDRDDANFDLPRPLRDALDALHTAPPVPLVLDDRILFAARDGFARRLRTRMILRRTAAAGGAVAAAIAVFFGVQAVRTAGTSPPRQMAVNAAQHVVGDVNGDGRVDILDALMLARRVEAGDVTARPWEDLDRDGKVTRADVEQVAQLAVTLPDSDVSGGARLQ
jgi:hypothetical protein